MKQYNDIKDIHVPGHDCLVNKMKNIDIRYYLSNVRPLLTTKLNLM